jgi:hypothetical protein
MVETFRLAISLSAILIGLLIVVWSWQLVATRKAKAAITNSDEYRRLSEMAITTQEHTDLKLSEINMQITQLRNQLEQVQKILTDVE